MRKLILGTALALALTTGAQTWARCFGLADTDPCWTKYYKENPAAASAEYQQSLQARLNTLNQIGAAREGPTDPTWSYNQAEAFCMKLYGGSNDMTTGCISRKLTGHN